jgi:hypothetical protein
MLTKLSDQILDKLLPGLCLGLIFPILGFLTGWWLTFSFLSDVMTAIAALSGLLIGLLVDLIFLKKWVEKAYVIDLKVWMAVYLFYAIGMFGFFMGVPVFHVLLAIPAGLFMGTRLALRAAGQPEVRRMTRVTCIFTTLVLALICGMSALVALVDPYTAGSIQHMLGLPFEVTRAMLVGIIVVGGAILLTLQWVITGLAINLTYKWRTQRR